MSDERQTKADALLGEALASSGAPDPRELCRERLRDLKRGDAARYDEAVGYYRETLLASIADDRAEPLAAWTEYGRVLAELISPGRTVVVDGTGRASPYRAPADTGVLVLHLPDDKRARTMLVSLPAEPTHAQRATAAWLTEGRTTLQGVS